MTQLKLVKRRPTLKIDIFNLDLFSSRSYSETSQQQVTREFRFLDLVDQKMDQHLDRSQTREVIPRKTTEPAVDKSGAWYRPVLLEGQPAIELTDQFVAEMEKMRRMLDAIMDDFSRLNVIRQSPGGGCFHLSRISQLNSNLSFRDATQPPPRLSAYEYSESARFSYAESEQTQFSANGVVNTLDGNPEEIQAPAWGTGFLALDKNKNGIINDGYELFGPSTGDGFAELAAYDLDKNFWIDENDAVFDDLSLYGMDENGEMHLTRIKDAGMGAIYLAGVDTAFDMKNKDNELLARIKRSSIALNEDGSVSSVQEADWTA